MTAPPALSVALPAPPSVSCRLHKETPVEKPMGRPPPMAQSAGCPMPSCTSTDDTYATADMFSIVPRSVSTGCAAPFDATPMAAPAIKSEAARPPRIGAAYQLGARGNAARMRSPEDDVRRFELSEGKSNKFWQARLDGSSMTVHFGRIGTNGQAQTKTFASAAAANVELEKLVREKLKKGYLEVPTGDDVANSPTAAGKMPALHASAATTAPRPQGSGPVYKEVAGGIRIELPLGGGLYAGAMSESPTTQKLGAVQVSGERGRVPLDRFSPVVFS